jgi:hypothetical protein
MKMFESELKNNLNGLCHYLFGAREVLQSAVGNYRHNRHRNILLDQSNTWQPTRLTCVRTPPGVYSRQIYRHGMLAAQC